MRPVQTPGQSKHSTIRPSFIFKTRSINVMFAIKMLKQQKKK